MWQPGPRNLITDVRGLQVGNASCNQLLSGSTAILFDQPAHAAVEILGGAPGTRDTELLNPQNLVQQVDALVLSGGSAFGLDAASGVQSMLRARGRGFEVAGQYVPIVPAAILFDLANGGDKDWGLHSPYRELGMAAAEQAGFDFPLGSIGAGTGATTATCRGGLGSASAVLRNGAMVGALVAVNAVGSPMVGSSRHFWAAHFECGDEFGGLGHPHPLPQDASRLRTKFDLRAGAHTTIAVIATDLDLGKPELKRLAVAAHDGFARALYPAHTDFDGDLVFSAATGTAPRDLSPSDRLELAAAASVVMARAIARGVFHAASAPASAPLLAWRDMA
ncbi:peptidase T4 [Aureimonas ureilytica]|uniref:Peptidase T4 n=1 Tax=Aureimonas ureilytica TaxID=401562 RepID=A0A175RFG7_9HYPH|nr:P1 family peptidase [Aureimonas ureilytica]KTR02577.1 peptidase T4 [Aureimonas ureilytica]